MKYFISIKAFITFACIAGSTIVTSAEEASSDKVDSFFKGIVPEGKIILNSRLRYERVDQAGFSDIAEAVTYRMRLGYVTPDMSGFKALVEGEWIQALNDKDAFNAGGRNPGGRSKPIIADPEATELNRAWVSYTTDSGYSLKVGRQIIALDNHRWVGHVGWRQNIQTYDAATFTGTPAENLKFTYSYVDKVHRIFGDDWPDRAGPTGEFDSSSHLVNLKYSKTPIGSITGFVYLVDLENATAASSATYGVRLNGAWKPETGDYKIAYHASIANQSDYGSNPNEYQALYSTLSATYIEGAFQGGMGYELLASDDGIAVSAPLATLHKFNGWADVFLGTPANGLKDYYAQFGYKIKLGKGLLTKLIYHDYRSDIGDIDYGSELDLLAVYKFSKYSSVVAKYSDYQQGNAGTPGSREKFSIEFDFVY